MRPTLDDMVQAIFTFAQRAPSVGHHERFVVEHTANCAEVNSIAGSTGSSGSQQGEFGFAVDAVEANVVGHTIRCFDGLTIKLAVTVERAHPVSVAFQSTLTGWIRDFRTREELGLGARDASIGA